MLNTIQLPIGYNTMVLFALQVAVDNDHFIEYNHRNLNLASIQWVEVRGGATVTNIFVQ